MAQARHLQRKRTGTLVLATALLCGPVTNRTWAQDGRVPAQTVVTIVAKGAANPADVAQPAPLRASDLEVSVDYKSTAATALVPLRGERAGLELVLLIDDSARARLSQQLPDLKRFVNALPAQAQVGVAYMQNGRAVMIQNLTPDHATASSSLRMPEGSPGSNASPYFCLSDLAKHWPGTDPDSRREVLMVTDGADAYGGGGFDPEDPYVLAAIADSQRAGLIVHSIYYRDAGDGPGGEFAGQDYLLMVSRGTGGKAYYQMSGSPVSFQPYLDDLHTRLMNQYELGFTAQPKRRAELQQFKVKTEVKGVSLDAPEKVLVRGTEDRAPR